MKLGLYLRNMGPQSTRDVLAVRARAPRRPASTISGSPITSPSRPTTPKARAAATSIRWRRSPFSPGPPTHRSRHRRAGPAVSPAAADREVGGDRSRSCPAGACSSASASAGWRRSSAPLGVDAKAARRDHRRDARLPHRCFAADEVEANGQRFLFMPRPPRPPIFVGGAPPHAFRRAVALRRRLDAGRRRAPRGWTPDRRAARWDGRGRQDVAGVVLLQAAARRRRRRARRGEVAALGVTRVVHAWRYPDADEFARVAARLVAARDLGDTAQA